MMSIDLMQKRDRPTSLHRCDVWGDTVNTASRMESHGAAGRIQVTDKVRLALWNDYRFAGPSVVVSRSEQCSD